MPTFEKKTRLPVSADALYRWHMQPGAFDRLVPPWQKVRVIERPDRLEEGCELVMKIYPGPFGLVGIRWVAEHRDFVEGRQFVDVQRRGPFAKWVHTHRFEPDGPDHSILHDHIEYALPMGAVGRFFGGAMTRRMLEQMFDYRHSRTRRDLMEQQTYGNQKPIRVAVSGASGLLGSHLCDRLRSAGHEVIPLVRRRSDVKEANGKAVYWNHREMEIDREGLEGVDAVIHLAGESVFGRWTDAKKQRIMESRRQGTELLARALAELRDPPQVFVSASGVNYYGDTGAEPVDESRGPGDQFLSEVCQAWEETTEPAAQAGIRTVNTRFGVVLSKDGGALATMLTPFKLGVGGRIGSGEQFMSWIHIEDVVKALHFCVFNGEIDGPVNVVAPQAVTNREFTDILGDVINRPTAIPLPKFGAKMVFGQMADEMLLGSVRAVPAKLEEHGFTWDHPTLNEALKYELRS